MEQDRFELSSIEVKEEPPGEFDQIVLSSDDPLAATPVEAFKCDIYDKSFPGPNNLKIHQNAVHDETKVSCNVCFKICKNQLALREHSKIHVKVEWCGYSSKTKRAHRKRARQFTKKHCCVKCGKVFNSRCALRYHTNSKTVHKCAACDITFSCKLLCDRHRSEIHAGIVLKLEVLKLEAKTFNGDKKFKCDKCSYQAASKILIAGHLRRHDKQFACETCSKMFATSHLIKIHQMHHKHGIYANAPEVTFNCDKCDKSFSNPEYLKGHQREVHQPTEIICGVCGKISKSRSLYHSHRQTHKSSIPGLVCLKCGQEFNSKSSLRCHKKSKKIYKCAACDATFSCKRLRDRHQSEFHGAVLKCSKCSYETTNSQNLIKHSWGHDKKFACSTCQEKFASNDLLKRHQRTRRHGIYATTPVEAFDCDICDKSFPTPTYLWQHKNAVHDETEVICDVCAKICKNQHALRSHSRTHTKVECPVCLKILTANYLPDHMRTHPADNPFKCDLCEYSSDLKRSLKAHIEKEHLQGNEHEVTEETHEEEEPTRQYTRKKYCCTKCGQDFNSRSGLWHHTKSKAIHKCATCDASFACKLLHDRHQSEFHEAVLKDKTFKCDKCSYQAASKYILASHQGIHEKAFACETCSKTVATNFLLKIHQMQHKHGDYANAPEVTFNCVVCDKSFSSSNYLKSHQRKVHEGTEIICDVCGKIFTSRNSYQSHRQTHKSSICNKVKPAPLAMETFYLRSYSSGKISETDRSTETEGQLEKLQSDVNDFDAPSADEDFETPNELNEDEDEDVDSTLAQAEPKEEPSEEHFLDPKSKPKRWVKSVEVQKFDADWRIKSKLFQTFFNV